MNLPLRARARRALRLGGWGLAAALAAFHAERLAARLQQGDFEGLAVLRWAGAGALLLALAALRRLGPIRGRRALALALAVLALHAPAAPVDAGLDALAALPAVALPAVLLLVAVALAAKLVRPAHAPRPLAAPGALPLRLAPARSAVAPRPPPLRVRFR